MKRYSWNYMAGLFDGEGCIDVQVCKRAAYPDTFFVRPRVRIAMAISAEFLLKEFQLNYGGAICYRRNSNKNSVWQDAVSWELAGKEVVENFLEDIADHLVLKKEQALLCIWWLRNMSNTRRDSKGCSNINQARTILTEELKAMKRDPQRLSVRAVQKIQALMRQSDPSGDVGTATEMIAALA